ncbi:uncharacterized protein LOC124720308 [Schistocerca piceifrons]|uniref:uncharacterized protein LOC124720308 n=1 Tax=Schistocerca piceifrons TaxID=274613 RepID=UPI001F5E96B6|nr:uncharacterized protein LOC124720308 [Schistocerca piceifrons]
MDFVKQNNHDGAPPHCGIGVRELSEERLPGKWIGRRGPVEWPPRSPDLTPLDFYLWGHLKQIVYAESIRDLRHLGERMQHACDQIAATTVVHRTGWTTLRTGVVAVGMKDCDIDVVLSVTWIRFILQTRCPQFSLDDSLSATEAAVCEVGKEVRVRRSRHGVSSSRDGTRCSATGRSVPKPPDSSATLVAEVLAEPVIRGGTLLHAPSRTAHSWPVWEIFHPLLRLERGRKAGRGGRATAATCAGECPRTTCGSARPL